MQNNWVDFFVCQFPDVSFFRLSITRPKQVCLVQECISFPYRLYAWVIRERIYRKIQELDLSQRKNWPSDKCLRYCLVIPLPVGLHHAKITKLQNMRAYFILIRILFSVALWEDKSHSAGQVNVRPSYILTNTQFSLYPMLHHPLNLGPSEVPCPMSFYRCLFLSSFLSYCFLPSFFYPFYFSFCFLSIRLLFFSFFLTLT